jgi:hypothetical protein
MGWRGSGSNSSTDWGRFRNQTLWELLTIGPFVPIDVSDLRFPVFEEYFICTRAQNWADIGEIAVRAVRNATSTRGKQTWPSASAVQRAVLRSATAVSKSWCPFPFQKASQALPCRSLEDLHFDPIRTMPESNGSTFIDFGFRAIRRRR